MADSTVQLQSLSDLLEIAVDEGFDWDPSALADWPNIAPAHGTALSFSANMPDETIHAS